VANNWGTACAGPAVPLLLVEIVTADQCALRARLVLGHQHHGALRCDFQLAIAHAFAGFAFLEGFAERLLCRFARIVEGGIQRQREADTIPTLPGKAWLTFMPITETFAFGRK
jgi:hypothetical protein